jgi:hypothetical protein
MRITASRRLLVPLACLLGVALWAGSARAAPASFKVPLGGTQQVPAVQTAGTGTADLTYDPATRVITWAITYNGLSGPVTMAHFHGPAELGTNGPAQIWLTEKGSPVESPIKGRATLTPDQAKEFEAGKWYINLHTQNHLGGEIRGQVMPPKS